MSRQYFRAILPIAAALGLGACATGSDVATFVTKTSFAIVDVDSVPASVTVAYDRFEGYVGPRFDDGSVYPVVGYVETTGSFASRSLRQVYAGGPAARVVTAGSAGAAETAATAAHAAASAAAVAAVAAANAASQPAPGRNILVFATGTTIGLKIGFAEVGAPTSFTLGYKRKEASVIPVDKVRQPAILASLDNATQVAAAASSAFGVRQFFATGDAAINLARLSAIRSRFEDKASEAVGVAAFRTQEAAQGRLALDAVSCTLSAPDGRLAAIWRNAAETGIFADTKTLDDIGVAKTPAAQRDLYAKRLAALIDPASADYTRRLQRHSDFVCS